MMKKTAFAITLLFMSVLVPVEGKLGIPSIEELKSMNVTVDLKEPVYENGEMWTDQGGVIEADGVRIQARRIRFVKKKEGDVSISRVEAEGDLLFEFHGKIFVGERVIYDFVTNTGEIIKPRGAIESWFIGGERIVIHADKSFTAYKTYITTCDHEVTGWQIEADEATVKNDNIARVKNVRFQFVRIPILWIPRMMVDLTESFDIPVTYRVSAGGSAGVLLSMRYKLFAWEDLKVYTTFDIRTRKGLGGGIETEYDPKKSDTYFYTRNYLARDGSLLHSGQDTRYEIAGKFYTVMEDERYTVDGKWDKLSDKDMKHDYRDSGLKLETAEKTEFNLRRRDEDTISWVTMKVRLNNFQTVKQELPEFNGTIRPLNLGCTGVVMENSGSFGYLDYRYAKVLPVEDYHSLRGELKSDIYRPFHPVNGVTLMPEAGASLIYYENSPMERSKTLLAPYVGGRFEADFIKVEGCRKRVITPYASYRYRPDPTVDVGEHYIFDITDGYARLNQATVGVEHQIFRKVDTRLFRVVTANVWTHCFFDTPAMERSIPKTYGSVVWNPDECITTRVEGAWDHERGEIGYFNARCAMTVTEDLAFAAEGRYRNAFEWRKSDRENFMMESYVPEGVLRGSVISDRRTTVLFNGFYRMNPNFAFQTEFRHGTAREGEPAYNEYEVSLLGYMDCGWDLRLSYAQSEYDSSFGFTLKLRPGARESGCARVENWLR